MFFYFKGVYLKKSLYFNIETFFFLEQQMFPRYRQTHAFVSALADKVDVRVTAKVGSSNFENIVVLFDILYFLLGSSGLFLSLKSIASKLSKKDPRFSSQEKKQLLTFSQKPRGFVASLDFFFFVFFLSLSADTLVKSVPFYFLLKYDFPEYQRLLRGYNRIFSKRLYFRALYSEMVKEFRAFLVFRNVKKFDFLRYFFFRLF